MFTATNDSINCHIRIIFSIIHQIISTAFSTYNHQASIKSFALHLSDDHIHHQALHHRTRSNNFVSHSSIRCSFAANFSIISKLAPQSFIFRSASQPFFFRLYNLISFLTSSSSSFFFFFISLKTQHRL